MEIINYAGYDALCYVQPKLSVFPTLQGRYTTEEINKYGWRILAREHNGKKDAITQILANDPEIKHITPRSILSLNSH